MLACVDVDYRSGFAIAACITFRSWDDDSPTDEHTTRIENVEPYIPGQFFRRELPCILQVLEPYISCKLDCIVVDGYVWLHDEDSPGLGAYLFNELSQSIPVIGVAKNLFSGACIAKEACRGNSQRPLYVTAAGVDLETAVKHIQSMHGEFRIPTMLKKVDTLARVS